MWGPTHLAFMTNSYSVIQLAMLADVWFRSNLTVQSNWPISIDTWLTCFALRDPSWPTYNADPTVLYPVWDLIHERYITGIHVDDPSKASKASKASQAFERVRRFRWTLVKAFTSVRKPNRQKRQNCQNDLKRQKRDKATKRDKTNKKRQNCQNNSKRQKKDQ